MELSWSVIGSPGWSGHEWARRRIACARCGSGRGPGRPPPRRTPVPSRAARRGPATAPRPDSVRWYSKRSGPDWYCRRSTTPASTSALRRAAIRSRGAPVPSTISVKRWAPSDSSRTTSSDQRSPTSSSEAAMGQGRPGRSARVIGAAGAVVMVLLSSQSEFESQTDSGRVVRGLLADPPEAPHRPGRARAPRWSWSPTSPRWPRVPQTVADLGAGSGARAWILSSMSVGLAAGLLASGALGDAWGRRRVYVAGLALLAARVAGLRRSRRRARSSWGHACSRASAAPPSSRAVWPSWRTPSPNLLLVPTPPASGVRAWAWGSPSGRSSLLPSTSERAGARPTPWSGPWPSGCSGRACGGCPTRRPRSRGGWTCPAC